MPAEARRQALARLGLLALAGAWPVSSALAGRQIEEQLSHAVRTALSAAVAGSAPPEPVFTSDADRSAHAAWLPASSARLARFMPHPVDRQEFLQTLWYESRRAGLSLSLVLGLVQVESGFRKYAVSSAGAMGYMQIMPFWSRVIGDGDPGRLFHMQTNLRFGCVILRHLLDREDGDLFMGLGRYNGSRGQAAYPRAVLAAQDVWRHAVD
jgi:soluble lytic murein transglycosylase-like protein